MCWFLRRKLRFWTFLLLLPAACTKAPAGVSSSGTDNQPIEEESDGGAGIINASKYHQSGQYQNLSGTPPCTENESRSCGPCGSGTQVCGTQGAWGECKVPSDACVPGTQVACDRCGAKTCSATCKWSTCNSPQCCAGDRVSCENSGVKVCLDGVLSPCIGGNTCPNGQQDNGETDVDCGGTKCSGCNNGQNCVEDRDCLSHSCNLITKKCDRCNGGVKPKVVFVVDFSGSMQINRGIYSIDSQTRWQVLVNALRQVVTDNRNRFDFGAIRFPGTQDMPTYCPDFHYDYRTGQNITDGTSRIIVNFGADNLPIFLNASPYSGVFAQPYDSPGVLDEWNWTPLLQTLRNLPNRMSQMWSRISNLPRTEPIYVVLISDGLHQCGPNLLYSPDPNDQAQLYQAALDLLDDNVKIYPVGFASNRASDNGLDVLTLNRIADVFGTKRSPNCVVNSTLSANSCTYDATSTSELTNSLSKILTDICK